MANLGDLKTRIITEVNRNDLEDELASSLTLCIQRAVNKFAIQRFKFNELRVTTATVINSQYLDIPTGTRVLDDPYLLVGGVRFNLTKRSMPYIENLYSTPLGGQPTDYCYWTDDTIRMWPTPQLEYPIIWLTVVDQTPLVNDADESAWTNTGQDVITAQTKIYLYRDYFRDAEGEAAAERQLSEAIAALKGESNRFIGTGRIRSFF